MVILNRERFREALENKGYGSAGELAAALGIHRNTIQHYLSGKSALPDALEKIIRALAIKPSEAFIEKKEPDFLKTEAIAGVVDELHKAFPEVTFVLFGSRATGRAHKYSDWDIGVYSRQGIEHSLYIKIAIQKSDLEDNLPYFIDIINLNRADPSFLNDMAKHWVFLTGSQLDWIALQKKARLS